MTDELDKEALKQRIILQQNEEFAGIYRKLAALPYSQTGEIMALEKELYTVLKANPENVTGLIILMQEQIMLGNTQRVKALAYKIWELGGKLTVESEKLYAENLINAGLLEMAGVLLKPRFDNIVDSMGHFYEPMLKYAVASGSCFLLEKIAAVAFGKREQKMVADFAAVTRRLDFESHFKGIQAAVYNKVKDVLCSYEFNLYDDRGFTDLEVVLYVDDAAGNADALYQEIDLQGITYCAINKTQRLNNHCFLVRNIHTHPALNQMSPAL